ncbi:hypothetical protein EVAR_37759_1 [Eumeta japonica]|uniref:Uncharacterized protein n=1 Tax=Eumeta variegata TaxID=151549 RepID=A0A4C1WM57_EUMVA|nr:hypothetical protein EVAR_37759_1 [Eumeta japonica]
MCVMGRSAWIALESPVLTELWIHREGATLRRRGGAGEARGGGRRVNSRRRALVKMGGAYATVQRLLSIVSWVDVRSSRPSANAIRSAERR